MGGWFGFFRARGILRSGGLAGFHGEVFHGEAKFFEGLAFFGDLADFIDPVEAFLGVVGLEAAHVVFHKLDIEAADFAFVCGEGGLGGICTTTNVRLCLPLMVKDRPPASRRRNPRTTAAHRLTRVPGMASNQETTTGRDYVAETQRKLLTQKEAAVLLSVGLRTVEKLIADADIPVIRIRGAVRIRPSDLEDYCRARLGN